MRIIIYVCANALMQFLLTENKRIWEKNCEHKFRMFYRLRITVNFMQYYLFAY